jgi:phosphate transport system substrate-binding protein
VVLGSCLLIGTTALLLAACAPNTAGQTAPAGERPSGSAPAAQQPASSGPDLRSLSGSIAIDGSSTVFPISEAMAEEFQRATGGRVRVTVGISGTGGGFQKFCNGETDISDASRSIRAAEIERCKASGIEFIEVPVAFDGLSVMVNPRNDWVRSMTVSELKKVWEPEAQGVITRWNQIRPEWPDRPFRLYGPGTDSGTFDYFTEAINGRERASRGDFTASEDDNVLVTGIANDLDALGYFGYAYYAENRDKLKLVALDHEKGRGPVAPSKETIEGGTYTPLSRPIFVYVKTVALDRPEVREFMRFYTDPQHTDLIAHTGYVPLPATIYPQLWQRVQAKQGGTVFGGVAAENVTANDLVKTPSMP